MKYELERFDKKIKKSYQDVKKYDVAEFQYRDFNNWVCGVILKLTPSKNGRMLKVEFSTLDGVKETAYCYVYNDKYYFDIVGTAKEVTKEEDIQK